MIGSSIVLNSVFQSEVITIGQVLVEMQSQIIRIIRRNMKVHKSLGQVFIGRSVGDIAASFSQGLVSFCP